MRVTSIWNGLVAAGTATFAASSAVAQEGGEQGAGSGELPIIGIPVPGGVNWQPSVTDVGAQTRWLANYVDLIMLAIFIFVTLLVAWCIFRFNRKRNPVPAQFTHNSPVEITWTVVPVVILVIIGAFSLPVLFYQQEIPEADITVKATGYQWFWGYEYPDHDFGFDSFMLERDELAEYGYPEETYQLATDTAMVVPVGSTVVVQVTGADVIHSWSVPALGVKQDGIPGRLAELWFEAEEEGIYFGHCYELCGINHAYMPITVKVVSQEDYQGWVANAVEEYGGDPESLANLDLASAQ